MTEPRNLAEWVASRPKSVRRVLAKYPLDSIVTDGVMPFYVLGATENGALIASFYDPRVDYDRAIARRVWFCAACLERGVVHRVRDGERIEHAAP